MGLLKRLFSNNLEEDKDLEVQDDSSIAELLGVFEKVIHEKSKDPKFRAAIGSVELANTDRIKLNTGKVFGVITSYLIHTRTQKKKLQNLLKEKSDYLDIAYIATDVYDVKRGQVKGGWERTADFNDLTYCDNATGLVSALYKRTVNGKIEYIYATAGTKMHNSKDWETNLSQVIGDSPQYEQALKNAIELSKRIDEAGHSLVFTGHSLGGGMASNNALATNHEAIVFNPAGLSSETMAKSKADKSKADQLITNFTTSKDVLNLMQDCVADIRVWNQLIPTSLGKRYYLKYKLENYSASSLIKGHSMSSIIEAMEQYLS